MDLSRIIYTKYTGLACVFLEWYTFSMLRKCAFVENEYYHIYNRGNSKQIIFKERSDYNRFVQLLYISNSTHSTKTRDVKDTYQFDREKELVAIGAYVLMPNHFHLLLTECEKGGITKFMQKLSTAYSMYFNKKYKRVGSLFEGKFKAQHLSTDKYLKYTFSYIHLNPIKLYQKNWKIDGLRNKRTAFDYLKKYPYSSFIDYATDKRVQKIILSKQKFPRYFLNEKTLEKEIFTWFNYGEDPDTQVLPML